MLADAVEAAVRTLPRPTPERTDEVVRRIVHERLEDGQLDECDLMFRDLEKIAQAFTRILTGIFHPRVEYPDLERDLRPRRRERVGRARAAAAGAGRRGGGGGGWGGGGGGRGHPPPPPPPPPPVARELRLLVIH